MGFCGTVHDNPPAGLAAQLVSPVVDLLSLQKHLSSVHKVAWLRHTARLGHSQLDKLKGSEMGDSHANRGAAAGVRTPRYSAEAAEP